MMANTDQKYVAGYMLTDAGRVSVLIQVNLVSGVAVYTTFPQEHPIGTFNRTWEDIGGGTSLEADAVSNYLRSKGWEVANN